MLGLMNDITSLCPLLVVRGAAQAIQFYQRALGARLLARFEHGAERRISHADLALGGARFSLTEELREWNSDAPDSLGGSPVVLQLGVADAATSLDALISAGASEVFPLQTFAGERMARVRDPFGHLWVLRQLLEPLSVDEIQRRRDELFAQLTVQRAPPPATPSPGSAASSGDRSGSPAPRSATTTAERPPVPAKDASTIGGAPAGEQASIVTASRKRRAAHLHLILGPVGAGKSTFARGLAHERSAIRLTLDDWMATLFRPDRPETGLPAWYAERAQRCIAQIWKLTVELSARGADVVLELGLLRREERDRFYALVDAAALPLTIHVLEAAREVRRERVLERNRNQGATFSMVVPPAIFELASDLWQAPDSDECASRDVRFRRTDLG